MRVALRSLRRTPGFALTAILTLALGIGLATAVFTVADALLLRRLPVQDQDRVVVLWGQKSDQGFAYPLGFDDAREFARRTRSLDRVAILASWGAAPLPIRDADQISRLRRALLSGEVRRRYPRVGTAAHHVRGWRAVHNRWRDAARPGLPTRHRLLDAGLGGDSPERFAVCLTPCDRPARAARNDHRRAGRAYDVLRPRRGVTLGP